MKKGALLPDLGFKAYSLRSKKIQYIKPAPLISFRELL
jgi:hypothetical protein